MHEIGALRSALHLVIGDDIVYTLWKRKEVHKRTALINDQCEYIVDFKKATTSEDAEKVYMEIIKKNLLNCDEISLKDLMNSLNRFKYEIRESIMRGERKYLPNVSAKELAAYKDPSTNQGVRGVLTWNMLEPDKLIDFPAKVSMLKMNLETEEELEKLKDKYPDKYKIIKKEIFNDETCGSKDWRACNKTNWNESISNSYK